MRAASEVADAESAIHPECSIDSPSERASKKVSYRLAWVLLIPDYREDASDRSQASDP